MGWIGLFFATGMLGFYGRLMRNDLRDGVDLFKEGSHYLKGASGELRVGEVLKRLPDEFIVFHDFHPRDANGSAARWNVDHIVIGPTGVFVIDAKNYGRSYVPSARRNSFSRKNVQQTQRNAVELKEKLDRWSASELSGLFVVPVVVYTQPNARLETLREGSVRTLPLKMLEREILSHKDGCIDQERAGRIARVLFTQLPSDSQYHFKAEFDAYGQLSKAARYEARDARVAARKTVEFAVAAAAGAALPEVCPMCGGKLVRRTARTGVRAGKDFLGCENFRATGCKYCFNLDDACAS